MSKHYLISTDLDGTLLDHSTYKFHKAVPALEYCQQHRVPIVFNTSKTFSETAHLCKVLDNIHPFIIENGSALYLPKDYFSKSIETDVACFDAGEYWLYKFGLNRSEILSRLAASAQAKKFNYRGFSTMTTRELCRCTGLPLDKAAEAKERQFSEPLLWQDSAENLDLFTEHLQQLGLNVIKGGRFVHVLGQSDKAKPLQLLKQMYQINNDADYTVIALGDSANDKTMLQCADIAVVIESPAHQDPVIDVHPNLIRSRFQGPVGWNETVLDLLRS
ncbi:HAD-IIB family hydrolase [Thalassotalea ponticola]|uniref:HAD-IIB family hydrolase n=1 Tax=Thalassotalea ponticola TaxID=1523392 RepID=UPI0025B5BD75|nr:HAD-IIB family hydrolase [Thalassotalea ponticola]MDN3653359.1 HAD-IIB family hydrolase [Thalassotalea ponticola]